MKEGENMNKMKKVSKTANELSLLIESLTSRQKDIDTYMKEEEEYLEQEYKNEDEKNMERGSSWGSKHRIEQIDDYDTQKQAISDIIKYLESYKF